MSTQKKAQARTQRRTYRVRNHLKKVNRSGKARVTVFRSNSNIYAQVVDDSKHHTLASFSSRQLEKDAGDKTAQAKSVGIALGKLAVEQDIKEIYFDRGSYLYHGRVKALADGLRESGLQF